MDDHSIHTSPSRPTAITTKRNVFTIRIPRASPTDASPGRNSRPKTKIRLKIKNNNDNNISTPSPNTSNVLLEDSVTKCDGLQMEGVNRRKRHVREDDCRRGKLPKLKKKSRKKIAMIKDEAIVTTEEHDSTSNSRDLELNCPGHIAGVAVKPKTLFNSAESIAHKTSPTPQNRRPAGLSHSPICDELQNVEMTSESMVDRVHEAEKSNSGFMLQQCVLQEDSRTMASDAQLLNPSLSDVTEFYTKRSGKGLPQSSLNCHGGTGGPYLFYPSGAPINVSAFKGFSSSLTTFLQADAPDSPRNCPSVMGAPMPSEYVLTQPFAHPIALQLPSLGAGFSAHMKFSTEIPVGPFYKATADSRLLEGKMRLINKNALNKEAPLSPRRSIVLRRISPGSEDVDISLNNLVSEIMDKFDFVPAESCQVEKVEYHEGSEGGIAVIQFISEKASRVILDSSCFEGSQWRVQCSKKNDGSLKDYSLNTETFSGHKLPLEPARTICITSVPPHWRKHDTLKHHFTRILKGNDDPEGHNVVSSVYFQPKFPDVYIELASEALADALVYRCMKNHKLLKRISENSFLCRHHKFLPLSSNFQRWFSSTRCSLPQKSLYFYTPQKASGNWAWRLRMLVEDILKRRENAEAYSGYVKSLEWSPVGNFIEFHFDSEATVDAVMGEYVENTSNFYLKEMPFSIYRGRKDTHVETTDTFYVLAPRQPEETAGCLQHRQQENFRCPDRILYGKQLEEKPSGAHGNCCIWTNGTGNLSASHSLCGTDRKCENSHAFCHIESEKCDSQQSQRNVFTGHLQGMNKDTILVDGLPSALHVQLMEGAINELFRRFLARSGLIQEEITVIRSFKSMGRGTQSLVKLESVEHANALISTYERFRLSGHRLELLRIDPEAVRAPKLDTSEGKVNVHPKMREVLDFRCNHAKCSRRSENSAFSIPFHGKDDMPISGDQQRLLVKMPCNGNDAKEDIYNGHVQLGQTQFRRNVPPLNCFCKNSSSTTQPFAQSGCSLTGLESDSLLPGGSSAEVDLEGLQCRVDQKCKRCQSYPSKKKQSTGLSQLSCGS